MTTLGGRKVDAGTATATMTLARDLAAADNGATDSTTSKTGAVGRGQGPTTPDSDWLFRDSTAEWSFCTADTTGFSSLHGHAVHVA